MKGIDKGLEKNKLFKLDRNGNNQMRDQNLKNKR